MLSVSEIEAGSLKMHSGEIRLDALFEEPYPASTLMIVSGFTREEFVVEIEAVAASPG